LPAAIRQCCVEMPVPGINGLSPHREVPLCVHVLKRGHLASDAGQVAISERHHNVLNIPFKRNFWTYTNRDLTYTLTESAKTSVPLLIMGKNKIPFILPCIYVTILVEIYNINIKTFAQILPQPNQHLKQWATSWRGCQKVCYFTIF